MLGANGLSKLKSAATDIPGTLNKFKDASVDLYNASRSKWNNGVEFISRQKDNLVNSYKTVKSVIGNKFNTVKETISATDEKLSAKIYDYVNNLGDNQFTYASVQSGGSITPSSRANSMFVDATENTKNYNNAVNSTLEASDELSNIRIVNRKYAGKTFHFDNEFIERSPKLSEKYPDLAIDYPNGVKFNDKGFPDFSPYSIIDVEIKNLKGNYTTDFTIANTIAGFKTTPAGYTWHHVEDGVTMMLVPSDLHDAVRHTGGASLIKNGLMP